MSERKFRLVFTGEAAESADIASIKRNIRNLLKTDEARVEKMFSAGPTILKNNIDHETALKYKAVFDKTGALSIIEAIAPQAVQATSQASHRYVSCPTCGLRQRETAICRTCGFPIERPNEKSPDIPPLKDAKESIVCSKCCLEQEKSPACMRCGVIFEKIAKQAAQEEPVSQAVDNKPPYKRHTIEPVTDVNPFMVTGNVLLPGTGGYLVAAIIVFILGCSSFAFSSYKLARTHIFVKSSHTTTGRVIGFASSRGSRSSSDLTYAPEVDFRAPDGRLVRFRSGLSCNLRFYDVGDDVPVRFDPSNPYKAEIDSFLPIWGAGVLTLLLGVLLPWLSLSMFKAHQRVKAFSSSRYAKDSGYIGSLMYCPKCYAQQPPTPICKCCHADLAAIQSKTKRWQTILFAAAGKVKGSELSGKDLKIKYSIQLLTFFLIASSFAWQAKSMFSITHTRNKEVPVNWRDSRNNIALTIPGDWHGNSTKVSEIDPILLNPRNDRYFLIISPKSGGKTYVAYGEPGFSLDHFKSAGWDDIVAEVGQSNRVKFSDVVRFNGLTVYRVGYEIAGGYREDAFIEGAKDLMEVCFVVPGTGGVDEQATRIRNMLATNLTAI